MASARPAGLGDGEVAGVGAGAGDDVAGQLGAGLGHADGLEPGVQRGQLLLGEAAEHEVLAVGERAPRAPSSRWIEASARNWSEVMSPSWAQAYGRHGALGDAAHDVGLVPALVGLGAR